MALTLPTASRDALTDTLVDRFDAGAGSGVIEIRSGTRPASANDLATGTLLATVTLAKPAFGTSATGVAALVDPAPVTAVATGTATWWRGMDSAGNVVTDGSVTATGGGGDLELATTSISTGLSVDITSGSITTPSG